MKHFSAIFSIVEEKNCPLYEIGEKLHLSDKTLSCPQGKEVCLILVRDMTELLFKMLATNDPELGQFQEEIFNCSGCTGLIKFSLCGKEPKVEESRLTGASAIIDSAVKGRYGKVLDSPFLKTFPAEEIDSILKQFKEVNLEKGGVLIRKGETNLNLYIILEGELGVEDGGVHLATLSEGELCGEMSYLGADVAVSTVRAASKARVLAMEGDIFGKLLGKNQEVQSYMAQILAKRLRRTNAARARDFESCMSGRIDEIVPAELFQIFHMHQKTGVLAMDLSGGEGKISFREGCIINAKYGQLTNEEAIFEMLSEKSGLYRFTTGLSPQEMRAAEIGDFMMLLMEGVKRVDEESGE